jgi:trehalose 6-phosphate phosphatase
MAYSSELPRWDDRWALFLDVDGTLLNIAAHPDDVRTTPRLKLLLRRAQAVLDGSVALVSGRSIVNLDRLFSPLTLPAAGLHGVERRSADGTVHFSASMDDRLHSVKHRLMEFAERHPGVLLEDNGAALALHYRNAPHLEDRSAELMSEVAQAAGREFHVQQGKMVLELKPAGHDKGTAVRRFMEEPPFTGRTPVFIGDDVTDEDGFAAVNELGGLSIRVGANGVTSARWRVENVEEFLAWLEANLLESGPGPKESLNVES